MNKKWRCRVCGYIHEGQQPPIQCPVCGAPRNMFELVDDDDDKPSARQ